MQLSKINYGDINQRDNSKMYTRAKGKNEIFGNRQKNGRMDRKRAVKKRKL